MQHKNYLHSIAIYQEFKGIYGRMCVGYAQIRHFYIRGLSLCGFWHLCGGSEGPGTNLPQIMGEAVRGNPSNNLAETGEIKSGVSVRRV